MYTNQSDRFDTTTTKYKAKEIIFMLHLQNKIALFFFFFGGDTQKSKRDEQQHKLSLASTC